MDDKLHRTNVDTFSRTNPNNLSIIVWPRLLCWVIRVVNNNKFGIVRVDQVLQFV